MEEGRPTVEDEEREPNEAEDVLVKRLREQLADFRPSTPPMNAAGSRVEASVVGLRLRALIARTTVRDIVSFHSRLIVLEARDSIDHCLMVHPPPQMV
jgi:hypothetical protein